MLLVFSCIHKLLLASSNSLFYTNLFAGWTSRHLPLENSSQTPSLDLGSLAGQNRYMLVYPWSSDPPGEFLAGVAARCCCQDGGGGGKLLASSGGLSRPIGACSRPRPALCLFTPPLMQPARGLSIGTSSPTLLAVPNNVLFTVIHSSPIAPVCTGYPPFRKRPFAYRPKPFLHCLRKRISLYHQ